MSPGGRLTLRTMGSWDSVYRCQMDSVMERTLSLQPPDSNS